MGKYSYITNNCGSVHWYFKEQREYDHPFIGCLFVNDLEFAKFCANFWEYIKLIPSFGVPSKTSKWASQNKNDGWYKHQDIKIPYPVMFLGDVEIHWIHETDEKSLMEKYNRRLSRLKPDQTFVFMFSDSDSMNNHTRSEKQEMLSIFMSTPTSIYTTQFPEDAQLHERIFLIDRWVGQTTDRNSSFIPLISQIGDRVIDYKNIIYRMNF